MSFQPPPAPVQLPDEQLNGLMMTPGRLVLPDDLRSTFTLAVEYFANDGSRQVTQYSLRSYSLSRDEIDQAFKPQSCDSKWKADAQTADAEALEHMKNTGEINVAK